MMQEIDSLGRVVRQVRPREKAMWDWDAHRLREAKFKTAVQEYERKSRDNRVRLEPIFPVNPHYGYDGTVCVYHSSVHIGNLESIRNTDPIAWRIADLAPFLDHTHNSLQQAVETLVDAWLTHISDVVADKRVTLSEPSWDGWEVSIDGKKRGSVYLTFPRLCAAWVKCEIY